MMIFKESLYGWGMCNIPKNRSERDIFSDRRKKTLRILIPDRRRKVITPGIVSIFSKLLIRDLPWFDVSLTTLFSLLFIFSLFLGGGLISDFPEKKMYKPVHMVIRIIEATKKALPLPEILPPAEEQEIVRESFILEKIEEKLEPDSYVKKKLTKKKKLLAFQNQEPIPEEPLPDIRLRPVIKKRDVETAKMPPRKIISFKKTTKFDEIQILQPVVRKRKYSTSQVENLEKQLPDSMSSAIFKKPDASVEIISQANPSKKKYRIDTLNRDLSATSDKMAESNMIALNQRIRSEKISLPEPGKADVRYLFEKNDPVLHSPIFPQTGTTPLSFKSQNKEEDLTVTPLPFKTFASNEPRPMQNISKGETKAPDLSDAFTNNEVDPSHIISLKELRVCADPEEEFNLKTKLATLLNGPSKYLVNGMIFFFKYTESGYTIQVDIYNPKGKLLADRCSVLNFVYGHLELSRHKGVSL